MANFADLIAARDLTLVDDAQWTTPGTDDLPNGEACTEPSATADALYDDTGDVFAIPWGVSDWTWEAWIRWTASAPGPSQTIMTHYDDPAYEWTILQPGSLSREVEFQLTTSTNYKVKTGAMTVGVWYQVNFLLKSSLGLGAVGGRTLKAYKNASLDNTATMPSTTYTPPTLADPLVSLLGAGGDIEIGKIAIYHRELTTGEMEDHYEAMTT